MHSMTFSFVLFTAWTGATPAEETWPQWRGPSGDSIVHGLSLPTRWSKTENIAWKAPLPGWGNSTPAIWKDTIFLTSQDDNTLLLLALDRRNGKVLWQREVGKGSLRRDGPVGNGKFHKEQNQATPSPVTDGRHVWAHFGSGDLACYDFAGNKLWSSDLTERFGPYTIWWGHANSPVLVGDLLISVCMQDPKDGGKSYVVAHDKETGKQKWAVTRDTGATKEPADSYTTPILYRHGGRTELIVHGGNVLDAYDPASGKRLWQCEIFKGNRVIPGPTLAGDTVFAVQGMKGPLFAVKAGGTGNVTGTHVLWEYKGATPDAATPLVVGGLVFLATNNGMAVCLDAANGHELWKERLGDAFRASPLAAGGSVYFLSKDGKATVVEAGRTFKVIERNELGEEIIASPAAVRGNLFIRTKGHLYCIGSPKD